MMDQQHWWKLLVSDKLGLVNTDDKVSGLIQTVTIIAVTGVATLSWTDLISVLLNAVTEHAFLRVYTHAHLFTQFIDDKDAVTGLNVSDNIRNNIPNWKQLACMYICIRNVFRQQLH